MFLKDRNNKSVPFSLDLIGIKGTNNQLHTKSVFSMEEKSFYSSVLSFLNKHKLHILYVVVIVAVILYIRRYINKKNKN